MRGWRSKLILVLVVYFAGFATAIYCLAPVPESQDSGASAKSFPDSALKSDQFARSFNGKMHKCIDFARDTASRACGLLKEKSDARSRQNGG